MAAPTASEQISPTAYATGHLWYRHGLSHPGLVTPQGRKLDTAFRAATGAVRLVSGFSFDALMLARHRGIDALLTRAIEEGRVGQVIEVAAGLSPRGWDFMRRYGERLVYVETDLPQMAATKRELLQRAGLLSARHRVVELDALRDSGADSLAGVAATLDPGVGTAIVTEGLMNYLAPELAQAVWHRFAAVLERFPQGSYFSDVYPRMREPGFALRVFGALLSRFVKGRMHDHFVTPADVVAGMRAAGFAQAAVTSPHDLPQTREHARVTGGDRVQILEARTALPHGSHYCNTP